MQTSQIQIHRVQVHTNTQNTGTHRYTEYKYTKPFYPYFLLYVHIWITHSASTQYHFTLLCCLAHINITAYTYANISNTYITITHNYFVVLCTQTSTLCKHFKSTSKPVKYLAVVLNTYKYTEQKRRENTYRDSLSLSSFSFFFFAFFSFFFVLFFKNPVSRKYRFRSTQQIQKHAHRHTWEYRSVEIKIYFYCSLSDKKLFVLLLWTFGNATYSSIIYFTTKPFKKHDHF